MVLKAACIAVNFTKTAASPGAKEAIIMILPPPCFSVKRMLLWSYLVLFFVSNFPARIGPTDIY